MGMYVYLLSLAFVCILCPLTSYHLAPTPRWGLRFNRRSIRYLQKSPASSADDSCTSSTGWSCQAFTLAYKRIDWLCEANLSNLPPCML